MVPIFFQIAMSSSKLSHLTNFLLFFDTWKTYFFWYCYSGILGWFFRLKYYLLRGLDRISLILPTLFAQSINKTYVHTNIIMYFVLHSVHSWIPFFSFFCQITICSSRIQSFNIFFLFFVTVKDEPDDSDNLAALTDFKEEDLKEFDNAVNDFSNGKHDLFYLISLITWVLIFCVEFQELSHLTRDLSQAEKKITVVTAEQLTKWQLFSLKMTMQLQPFCHFVLSL